jgi:hypothetical protein
VKYGFWGLKAEVIDLHQDHIQQAAIGNDKKVCFAVQNS